MAARTVDNNGQAITITQPILSSVGNGVATIPVSGGAGYIMPPQVASPVVAAAGRRLMPRSAAAR